jgi:hypothetical protein
LPRPRVNGWLATSHSPRSSVKRSPTWSCIGRTDVDGGVGGSSRRRFLATSQDRRLGGSWRGGSARAWSQVSCIRSSRIPATRSSGLIGVRQPGQIGSPLPVGSPGPARWTTLLGQLEQVVLVPALRTAATPYVELGREDLQLDTVPDVLLGDLELGGQAAEAIGIWPSSPAAGR